MNGYEAAVYTATGLAVSVSLAAFFSELSVAVAMLGVIAAAFLWLFSTREPNVVSTFDLDTWRNTTLANCR